MKTRGAALAGALIGIALAALGGLMVHYTNGVGVEHHTAWANEKGVPPPAYWMFVTGAALLLVGGIVIGRAFGPRRGPPA